MAGFTDEEVQASINKFLFTELAVDRLGTGARNVVALRDGVFDLITTALLLRPDSYFYVVYLAKNKLRYLVDQQISALDDIEEAGPNTTRAQKRVESTSELSNAKASILELNAGLNARSTGIRGSLGPAIDRFRRSVSRFITTELTKNVVESGEVVETGPELRNKISTIWADAKARHDDIQNIVGNISSALTSLAAVKLPERAVRDLVGRIQSRLDEIQVTLSGPEAVAESRESMLDLIAMRTLLTKASTFKNPEVSLMPKTGDSSILVMTDSEGVEPEVVGTVSAPFNYDPGTDLDLSINSGASTPTTVLPQTTTGSRAELRSRDLSGQFPGPAALSEVAIYRDFTATQTVLAIPALTWATGAIAAAALDAALGPTIEVTWDASTDQLVFQSALNGDASALRFLKDTANRQAFVDWAFGTDVYSIESLGRPVTIEDVIAAVSTSAALAKAEVEETSYADFVGERTAVGGEEATLWNRLDTGADLVANGTTTLTSPTHNFEGLGVKAGMGVAITSPYTTTRQIVSVSGNTLEIDAAAVAGVLTYRIGPDYTAVPVGARVQATGSKRDNTGFYRVASSGIGFIVMDRDFVETDDRIMVSVYTKLLKLSTHGTTTSSGIGALPGAGATALGLPTSEAGASLSEFALSGTGDFILRGVRVGDVIDLTSPSSAVFTVTVESLSPSGVVFDPPLPHEPGNWTYAIRSLRASSYTDLKEDVDVYLDSSFASDFTALDRLISRLISSARYAGEIQSAVATYRADLVSLQAALVGYSVPVERTVDNVVKTLREQGFDRALDLFLSLDVEELFSMDPDGVSYSTWLVRKSATAAREVVPVTKTPRGDRLVQEIRPLSYQPDPYDPLGQDDKVR